MLFASLLFNSYADEERKAVRPGMVSNQKYKAGTEQRKLSIKDPWFQLASARQLGSESVSIAIVSSDRSARVFN